MNPSDALSTAAEAIAWITVPLAVALLVAALARRSWAHRYTVAKAVVTDLHRGDATVRWFSGDGDVHEAIVAFDETPQSVGDARTIWVHPSRPDVARTDDPAHDGRVLMTLGVVLAVVGAMAVMLSFVVPLL